MRVRLLACAMVVGWVCGVAPAKIPIWREAARVYQTAMSQYRAREWRQALGLLEEFLKKYPTNENIPVAYLQLAYCKHVLKDPEGRDKALEVAIRRFPGSPAWFLAHGFKLRQALGAKKNDDYISLLEAMLRSTRRIAPLRLGEDISFNHRSYYFRESFSRVKWMRHHHNWSYDYWGLASPFRYPGWALDIVSAADTEDRAKKVLKALEATLRRYDKQLPPDWQFVHVALLRKAGQAEKADALFKGYAESWGKDPRAVGLWLLEGFAAQARKDEKTATAVFDHLIKAHPGGYVLREALAQRLSHLYRTGQYVPYTTLARFYLKTYPLSRHRGGVISQWVQLARRTAAKKKPEMYAEVMKMLDEAGGDENLDWRRTKLRWQFTLHMDLKQYAEAAKIVEELLSEKHWTSGHLSTYQRYVKTDKAIAKAVEDARKRYGIEPIDAKSPAAKMLADLKGRIKDRQLRFMEEIGEEMFSKHRKDPATIEAGRLLVEYYYSQVLVTQRDKWMKRMIVSYPRHPSTEHVLNRQIAAYGAARDYAKMAGSLDQAAQRFGGRGLSHWYRQRIQCYNAAKDEVGRVNYVKRVFADRLKKGDMAAQIELARYEVAVYQREDAKSRGDHWMRVAKKLAGTQGEVRCLYEAYLSYFYRPWHHRTAKRENICWNEARQAVTMLARQSVDPQMAWQVRFRDVDLHVYQGKAVAAIAALEAHLRDTKKPRDLGRYVGLTALGSVIGRGKQLRKGVNLIKKLRSACWTKADENALDAMHGEMYRAVGQPARGAGYYMKIVDRAPFPMAAYGSFRQVVRCLNEAGYTKTPSAITRYIAKIPRVQDYVPGLLYQSGYAYFRTKRRGIMSIRGKLAKQYPASGPRGQLEKLIASAIAKEREKKAPKKKGGRK